MAQKQDRERISLSLPTELVADLRAEAEARVLNEAVLVEKALKAYLPTLPPVNETVLGPRPGEEMDR